MLSASPRRHWVVLRRESGNYGNRVELYRSEDQSGEPVRNISLSSGVGVCVCVCVWCVCMCGVCACVCGVCVLMYMCVLVLNCFFVVTLK